MGKVIVPELPNIPVIYEDNHIIVIVKPVNLPSQSDISGDPDLLTILKQELKEKYNKPGKVFLSLVHRLDRPVGGVMVLAKTSKAASRLSSQMRQGAIGKIYLCIVNGVPNLIEDRLEHFLLKDRDKNVVRIVEENVKGAKAALLEYETLQTSRKLSLLKVKLLTGRSHQIRVQLTATGHSVYGDQKYGGKSAIVGQQLALWSSEIVFSHPTKKDEMHFTSSPPNTAPWKLFNLD